MEDTNGKERRNEKRFPVLREMDMPITLQLQHNQEIEGILLNLSATGIGLITFTPLKTGNKVNLSLKLGSLSAQNLQGKVIWSKSHKNAYRIGIKFARVDRSLAQEIKSIAEDYVDCEIKITLNVNEICFAECKYYYFCNKKQKIAP